MLLALGCLACYLLGSIPFGLVLVRLLLGVDIRKLGSGNVGATNAARAFGKRVRLPIFLLIYVLDFGKGFLPALLGEGLLEQVLLGAAAVLGHCTSPFLGFRGGKGVATTTGVFAVLAPWALLASFAAFFLVLALTRQVFLGSLCIGLVLFVGVVLEDPAAAIEARLPLTCLGAVVAASFFFTHRSNIREYRQRSPA